MTEDEEWTYDRIRRLLDEADSTFGGVVRADAVRGLLPAVPLAGVDPAAEPSPETVQAILDAPTAQRDGTTVRGYLVALLDAFWTDGVGSKRGMTGESDWRYDLYEPLRDLGLIPAWRDGYGVEYPEDGGHDDRDESRRQRADALISAAIQALAT